MAQELGIGLIGYGGIGRLHALCFRMLPLVYPNLPVAARLVAVATASAASAERARRELGDVFATTSADELLAHPNVGLIDCCAPTGDHARIGLAALQAGKALWCEKPLTADPAASAQLFTLAHERGLSGGVNYHFRWIPAIQEARRLIEDGLLGEIYGFHLRYYRASNVKADRPISWRFAGPGSGVLVDLGAHLIDLTLHLLGPIATVAAHTRTMIPARPDTEGRTVPVDGDDAVWLQIELADGGRGTLEASKMVPGAGDDLRIEAYGARGALFFDTADPNSLIVAEGAAASQGGRRIVTANRTFPTAALPGPETPVGVVQWHLASLAAFLQALGSGAPVEPGLGAGLAVDRVIAAARESAAHSGAPIGIPTL